MANIQTQICRIRICTQTDKRWWCVINFFIALRQIVKINITEMPKQIFLIYRRNVVQELLFSVTSHIQNKRVEVDEGLTEGKK